MVLLFSLDKKVSMLSLFPRSARAVHATRATRIALQLRTLPPTVLRTQSPLPFLNLQRRHLTMDTQELAAYFADSPPSVVRLEIAKHFDALTDKQKRYAHFISK